MQGAAPIGAGPQGGFRSVAPYISFALGAWGLLLLFFFYSRRDKELQSLARMGGMIGSAVAVVKYDQIIDSFVRLFGSGATWINLVLLCCAALAALVVLLWKTTRDLETDDELPTGIAISSSGANED